VHGGQEHGAFLRDWVAGHRPDRVPAELAAVLDRNAPAALVMDGFAARLRDETRRTPFPTAEVGRAWAATTGPP
jgi:hypothetical protein